MREIKFRAWNGKSMDYKEFLMHADGGILPTVESGMDIHAPVMQFTGLVDNNDVELYEGDLIGNGTGRIAVIVWHERMAGWDCDYVKGGGNDLGYLPISWHRSVEKIGDKYSNPELLEKSEC